MSNAYPSQTTPTLRPGERLVAGKVCVFNSDLLNAYVADQRVDGAPADLSGLSDKEVSELWGAWMSAARRRPHDPRVGAVGCIVCAEKDARDSMSLAFRPSRSPALLAAE